MVNLNRFYTYAYLREDRTPYYIGKGRGSRVYSSARTINKPRDKSRIVFLKKNLTEAEAFRHEIYMIAVFGRIDLETGILHNKTNGGEGTSGRICSEESKAKISSSNKGKKPPEETRQLWKIQRKGRKLSEETKRKISEGNKGKKLSKEQIERLVAIHKGKKRSEEYRKKLSLTKSQLWKITFYNGKTIMTIGLKEWAKENGYNRSHIGKIASGKAKKHKDIVAVEKLVHSSLPVGV
jgi:hypothetical protein